MHPEITARQFQVLQHHRDPRLVAGCEEARQQRLDDGRVAHDDVFPQAGGLRPVPAHRHQPQRAVEIRQHQRKLRQPVRPRLHRSGEQRDDLLRDRVGLRVDIAARALPQHRVGRTRRRQQPRPVVMDADPQHALAEEMGERIGCFEIG